MSVTAPQGFGAGAAVSGARGEKPDVAVVFSDRRATVGGVFTQNRMAAPCIDLTKGHMMDGLVQAVVVNSGNANACTGWQGMEDARAMAQAAGEALGIPATDVVVASTGVIGVPLDMAALAPAIGVAAGALDAKGGPAAAAAILTTDTHTKEVAVRVSVEGTHYVVGGMAKGAGMIRPDMATMLAFVTTDAPLTTAASDAALRIATERSFNRISVDGATSTNDMAALLANGAAGGEPISQADPRFAAIAEAVTTVCAGLARMIVKDGEGATKFVEVTVAGAASDEDAHAAAMAVADSPLFKCAIFGEDANWGRVVSAIGACGIEMDPGAVEVSFAGIKTAEHGTAVPFDEDAAAEALAKDEIEVAVDLHVGEGAASVWTCDLTYDYVKINADYRS